MTYPEWFERAAGFPPHSWQRELGESERCTDLLLRIPTGFGKTLGVLGAWLHQRVQRGNDAWPRRLIWCLPMRVLVEQTEHEVRATLTRLGILWNGAESHEGRVGVHTLMGGADSDDWHLYPEHCAVLIGTQDMLLSRALNRGYAAHRARWPIDFGLFHQDCLWVMDEVQLMDVGLATSGQLQAFRNASATGAQALRPCHTWWMSATLQRDWLACSPETQPLAASLSQVSIPKPERHGHLWDDVEKPISVKTLKNAAAIAGLATEEHLARGRGLQGPTLVVLNRVDTAIDVYDALKKDKRLRGTDKRLVHSRFRPHERAGWREAILNPNACSPGTDRIIVATQVVEAGVDMSAAVLVTELAPWSSLVQRFGRAARWGGVAQVLVADTAGIDDKAAAPYSKTELDAARAALQHLSAAAPLQLEAFEEEHKALLESLYPYAPKHLLLRHEVDDLFDTTADLSGADIDISRFIRSGEERDLQVFWHEVPKSTFPDRKLRASRGALCPVPFLKARDWLCGKETSTTKAARLKSGMRAWVWDWLDGSWRIVERSDLYPGQTVLVAAECGGYDEEVGWSSDSKKVVALVAVVEATKEESADATQDDEQLSVYDWQTIAGHGAQVGEHAARMAAILCPALRDLLNLAGRWHDVGKVHPAFQNCIKGRDEVPERPLRRDLAKAPKGAWQPRSRLYIDSGGKRRRSFRHELASTLRLFAVLIEHAPDHPALLGPWRVLLRAAGITDIDRAAASDTPANELEREVIALSAESFDLLTYLVCCHHGKVRAAWHASPADQEASDSVLRIRGIRDGETLPAVFLASTNGKSIEMQESVLLLAPAAMGLNPITGRGWTERVLDLLKRHCPFTLAYLEALLRAADQRASRESVADPLLQPEKAS